MNLEYKSKGIIVQSLCPFEVKTKLLKAIYKDELEAVSITDYFRPDPETYVKEAIKTLGSQSVTNGCLAHNIEATIFNSYLKHLITFFLNNIFLKYKGLYYGTFSYRSNGYVCFIRPIF